MKEFVLVKGEVAKVIRKEHYGNPFYWLVQDEHGALFYVNADWCTPLDPALNVLFERKENG